MSQVEKNVSQAENSPSQADNTTAVPSHLMDEISQICKTAPKDSAEPIPEEALFKALFIVNNLKYNNEADLLLYAAAMNLLSAYGSQSDSNLAFVSPVLRRYLGGFASNVATRPCKVMDVQLSGDGEHPSVLLQAGDESFSFPVDGLSTLAKENIRQHSSGRPDITVAPAPLQAALPLFDFLLHNSDGRSNLLMDGNDFEKGLSDALSQYQKGAFPLEKARMPVVRHFGRNRKNEPSAEDDSRQYPLRSLPVVTLYENSVGNLLQEIVHRTFIPKIIATFTKGFGFAFPERKTEELKYISEILLGMLSSEKVNPDAGVRLNYVRTQYDDYLALDLLSVNSEGVSNIAEILLLPWHTISIPGNSTVARYLSVKDGGYIDTIHPALLIFAYTKYIQMGVDSSLNLNTKECVFFYDADRCELDRSELEYPQDILDEMASSYSDDWDMLYSSMALDSKKEENYWVQECEKVPMFFSPERSDLMSFLDFAVRDKIGNEDLSGLRGLLLSKQAQNTGGIPSGMQYLASRVKNFLSESDRSFAVVDCQGFLERKALSRALSTALEGVEGVQILGESPDMWPVPSSEGISRLVLITNLSSLDDDRMAQYQKYHDQTNQLGYSQGYFPISDDSAFSDYGKGNYLLRSCLGIIPGKVPLWNSGAYSIQIVDHPDDTDPKPDIADVVVPSGIRYEPATGKVIASRKDLQKLQKDLQKGQNGVRLTIEDEPLKKRLQQVLDGFNQVSDYLATFSASDFAQKLDQKQLFNNSVLYHQQEQNTKALLGEEVWKRLGSDSKRWAVSAKIMYDEMIEDAPDMDYSGVVLMLSKIFEFELGRRISYGYIDYLRARFGDDYSKYPDTVFKTNAITGEREFFDPSRSTLGGIAYLTGLDPKCEIKDEKGYDLFKEFAKEKLLSNPENIDEQLHDIVDIAHHVRTRYRNEAAHKGAIQKDLARECIEYSLTKYKKLTKLLELFTH